MLPAHFSRWAAALRAGPENPIEAEQQPLKAGLTFATSFVQLGDGTWHVVLTPGQWVTLMREVLS